MQSTTYKDYLRVKKMRYARRLLLATELPMLEVAVQSGYETQNHFNREFKAYYGISPMEYRRNRAKNSVSGSGVKTQVNPQRKKQ